MTGITFPDNFKIRTADGTVHEIDLNKEADQQAAFKALLPYAIAFSNGEKLPVSFEYPLTFEASWEIQGRQQRETFTLENDLDARRKVSEYIGIVLELWGGNDDEYDPATFLDDMTAAE